MRFHKIIMHKKIGLAEDKAKNNLKIFPKNQDEALIHMCLLPVH